MLVAECGHLQIFESLLSIGNTNGELDLDSQDEVCLHL